MLLRGLMNRQLSMSLTFTHHPLPTFTATFMTPIMCKSTNDVVHTGICAKISDCVSELHEMSLWCNNELSESRDIRTAPLRPLAVKDTKQNCIQLKIQSFLVYIMSQITCKEKICPNLRYKIYFKIRARINHLETRHAWIYICFLRLSIFYTWIQSLLSSI